MRDRSLGQDEAIACPHRLRQPAQRIIVREGIKTGQVELVLLLLDIARMTPHVIHAVLVEGPTEDRTERNRGIDANAVVRPVGQLRPHRHVEQLGIGRDGV
ncbi:hypothetical protein SDC9_208529 [bioreactor metagenome]|uniref:Uncharacterized protein n=1 Tax=bioreactor metagenome TaxID=1076179 RepID=A0A645JBT8_9ZZZZ